MVRFSLSDSHLNVDSYAKTAVGFRMESVKRFQW